MIAGRERRRNKEEGRRKRRKEEEEGGRRRGGGEMIAGRGRGETIMFDAYQRDVCVCVSVSLLVNSYEHIVTPVQII